MQVTEQQRQDRGQIERSLQTEIENHLQQSRVGIHADQAAWDKINELDINGVRDEFKNSTSFFSNYDQQLGEQLLDNLDHKTAGLSDAIEQAIGGMSPEAIEEFLEKLTPETLKQFIHDVVIDDALRDTMLQAHEDGNIEGVIQVLTEVLEESLKDPARLMQIARTISEDPSVPVEVREELQKILESISEILTDLKTLLAEAELRQIEERAAEWLRPDRADILDVFKELDSGFVPSDQERDLELEEPEEDEDSGDAKLGIDNDAAIGKLEQHLEEIISRQGSIRQQLLLITDKGERSKLYSQQVTLIMQEGMIKSEISQLQSVDA